MSRLIYALLLAVLSIGLSACVTTKKKKDADVGPLKKRYHNLTLHYNYWFNANELFENSVVKLNEQVKDNYNQILPIFPYQQLEPQAAKADMDNVIKKSATGIGLHRPSAWADDAYLLIGAGQYVKKDYETAESTFRYIKEEYNPTALANKKAKLKKSKKKKSEKAEKKKKETAKKKKKSSSKKKKSSKNKKKSSSKKKSSASKSKKEEVKKTDSKTESTPAEKPKAKQEEKDEPVTLPVGKDPYKVGLFNKTRAAYPESMIWYARTLTAREKYLDAEFQIREIAADPHLPKSLRDDLGLAQADLYIAQKKYAEAIKPLEWAIDNTRSKKKKARLYFILSQLYDKTKNTAGAYAALDKAARYAPNFELAFNARLKKILSGWETGAMTASQADNTLNKMARETKNADYRDQIYFTLASIALKNKQKQEAIDYLKQSLAYNTNNQTQRAESYYTLADLYFNAEDFINAKLYYDSTLAVLSNKDERFKQVKQYSESLTDISKHLTTIAKNDSIVRVFRMSPDEREAFAKEIKKKLDEEAAAAAKDTTGTAGTAPAVSAIGAPPVAGLRISTFYFYNETFVRKGKRDFERIWGERPLEDNWRRKNRTNIGAIADTGKQDNTDTGKATNSDNDINQILAGLPASEAELEVIHLNTYEAMFQLGKAYRDKLERNDKCASTLEELLKRYPENTRNQAEVWYYCHIAYRDMGNQAKAQYYLDLLKEKHPKTPFTLSLTDPNFAAFGKDKDKDLNDYYKQIFALYEKDQYKQVLDLINAAPPKFGTLHALMPKFALLKAMCIGNLEGNEAYCKELKTVIATYPNGPESVRAKEVARLISCEGFKDALPNPDNKPIDPAAEAFTTDDDKIHYFLVVLHGADIKINDVKAAMTDFVNKNYATDALKVSNIFLGTDVNTPIMVLRKFDNKTTAMRFYNAVLNDKALLGENDKKHYAKELYPITQENYRRILKNRSLAGYDEFFRNNYGK